MKRFVFVVVAVLMAIPAEAGLEVRPFFAAAPPDGTIVYGYRVRLVSGRLDPASPVSHHVTLYDIPALIPGSAFGGAGWTWTEQATGLDGDDVPRRNREDAPRHMNITWRWTGTEVVEAPAELGSISFSVVRDDSIPVRTILYTGQTTAASGPPRAVAIVGRVTGPGVP